VRCWPGPAAAQYRYHDFLVPCCAGWHVLHVRVRTGSLHHWILSKVREMAK
jgi:hypothetical protein